MVSVERAVLDTRGPLWRRTATEVTVANTERPSKNSHLGSTPTPTVPLMRNTALLELSLQLGSDTVALASTRKQKQVGDEHE